MEPMDIKLQQEQELCEARAELESWKKRVKDAENERDKLMLEKLDSDEEKRKANQDVIDLMNNGEKLKASYDDMLENIQAEMNAINKSNQDLQKNLQHLKQQLNLKRAETAHLQQRFKIKAQIPEKKMKFTHVVNEQEEDECDERENAYQEIRAVFTIIQRPSFLLKGGDALITFEEEKVADQILKLPRCNVACDGNRNEVKPHIITLEPSAKFEVHINVSKRTIRFSDAFTRLPEERMRDRLELGFSKPSRGGGEVESVEFDAKTGSGYVTFVDTGGLEMLHELLLEFGSSLSFSLIHFRLHCFFSLFASFPVAEKLTLRGNFFIDAVGETEITVEPSYKYHLKKFQTFLGVPKRSVLLRGSQDVSDEDDMQDHLEIYFQKPSNYGGEVENIKYVGNGKTLQAFFHEDQEAQ